MAKTVAESAKEHLKIQYENLNLIIIEQNNCFQEIFNAVTKVSEELASGKIKLKIRIPSRVKTNSGYSIGSDAGSETIKRGRPKKKKIVNREECGRSEESDDSTSSRSQRAAAQAAGENMARAQSFMKAKKLRRPTDYDDSQSRRVGVNTSPPPKSRKTHNKQSAGSTSSLETDETNESLEKSKNVHLLNNSCLVSVDKLRNSVIKLYSAKNTLQEVNMQSRESSDLFEDCNGHEDGTQKPLPANKQTMTVESVTEVVATNSSSSLDEPFKGFDFQCNSIKSTKPVLRGNTFVKNVHSDSEVYDRFEKQHYETKRLSDSNYDSNVEFIVETKTGSNFCKKKVNQNNFKMIPQNASVPCLEVVSGIRVCDEGTLKLCNVKPETSNNGNNIDGGSVNNFSTLNKAPKAQSEYDSDSGEINIKSRTRTIKKPNSGKNDSKKDESLSKIKTSEKEIRANTETDSDSPGMNLKSRTRIIKKNNETEVHENKPQLQTKVIKKAPQHIKEHIKPDADDLNNLTSPSTAPNTGSCTSEKNLKSRTKVIKKHGEIPEDNIQNQPKTLGKDKKLDENSSIELKHLSPPYTTSDKPYPSDSSEMNLNSRTTVVKTKGTDVLENQSQSLINEIKILSKPNDTEDKKTQKDKVSQKILDHTENQLGISGGQIEQENSNDLQSLTKQPRKQEKKLKVDSAAASHISGKGDLVKKRIEDYEKMTMPAAVVEEVATGRVTRLALKGRQAPMTEPLETRMNRGKGLNSATRPAPLEVSTALVHKQAAEEVLKKKREDERLKRQAKEDIAKQKKEKVMKATAEEARRKREEKNKKVAAAREAHEKEKKMLALKAEKEKEEKMQQIAAEKEKQREEALKKKQLAQQKALEHEERRKQEEEARIAKLKEQEEEHKRILAMKERELEVQKQMKSGESRLADAEKAKPTNQVSTLGKFAIVNNAKMQKVMTPASQTEAQSYEITPAREDRPPIEPKSENDYGIDDAKSGDSSDDEAQPKKKIPLWAQPGNRAKLIKRVCRLPKQLLPLFMEGNVNPDVHKIFAGNPIKKRIRTSSAVWNTPPRCF